MSREGPPDEGCPYGVSAASAGTVARATARRPRTDVPYRLCARSRLILKVEDQSSALHELCMLNRKSTHSLAVPHCGLYIESLRRFAFRFNHQLSSACEIHFHPIEQRSSEIVASTHRVDRIETQRADNEPGRHLPAVFVAGHAIRLVVVHGLQQTANALLRLMRRTRVVIKVSDVMARLVPMRVLPHHPRNIRRHIRRQLRALVEELVQLFFKRLVASKGLN